MNSHPISVSFAITPFEQLSLSELYAILRLRQEVFIVEQHCPYLDADGLDEDSWHVMGKDQYGSLLAYARILPRGVSYADYPSIGRIITSKHIRGTGIGRKLVSVSIDFLYELFGVQSIKIGAQCYLDAFYRSFGFVPIGEPYLEDGIWHVGMLLEIR